MLESSETSAYVADILLQPDCLRRLRMEDVRDAIGPIGQSIKRYDRVVLTGMGSSFSALRPLWLALLEIGTPAWLVDTAECLAHLTPLLDSSTLVIAASQSGRSAELVALGEEVRARRGILLAITNDPASPLALNANAVVDIRVGIETAVSTKTYLNTLGVGAALARVFLQRELDDSLARTADAIASYLIDWRQRTDHLKDAFGLPQRLYFLGRGASLAAAQYGSLITKEAARWPVEAQSAPQFRHGPLELADPDLTVVILAGQKGVARKYNQALFADLLSFSARAFWLDTDTDGGPLTIPTTAADTRWIAEAIPLQLLSIAIAEQVGIRPGVFHHLSKVTTVL